MLWTIYSRMTKAEKPKKSFIKTALAGLKAIQGAAEFVTAVAALAEFLQTVL